MGKQISQKLSTTEGLMKLEDEFDFVLNIVSAAMIASGTVFLGMLDSLLASMLLGFFLLLGCTLFNQYYDYAVDKVNKPNRPIPMGAITRSHVLKLAITSWLLTLILGAYLGLTQIIIVFVGIFIGLAYSHPKSRISSHRVLGLLLLTFGYVVLTFFIGWTLYADISLIPIWYLLLLFTTDLGAGMVKDYPDYEGDKKFGVKTLPVLIGYHRAIKLNAVLYCAPFLFLPTLYLFGYLNLGFALIGTVFPLMGALVFMNLLRRSDKRTSQKAYWMMTLNIILLRFVAVWAFISFA